MGDGNQPGRQWDWEYLHEPGTYPSGIRNSHGFERRFQSTHAGGRGRNDGRPHPS